MTWWDCAHCKERVVDYSILRDETVYYAVPPCELTPGFVPPGRTAVPKSAPKARMPTPPLDRAEATRRNQEIPSGSGGAPLYGPAAPSGQEHLSFTCPRCHRQWQRRGTGPLSTRCPVCEPAPSASSDAGTSSVSHDLSILQQYREIQNHTQVPEDPILQQARMILEQHAVQTMSQHETTKRERDLSDVVLDMEWVTEESFGAFPDNGSEQSLRSGTSAHTAHTQMPQGPSAAAAAEPSPTGPAMSMGPMPPPQASPTTPDPQARINELMAELAQLMAPNQAPRRQ